MGKRKVVNSDQNTAGRSTLLRVQVRPWCSDRVPGAAFHRAARSLSSRALLHVHQSGVRDSNRTVEGTISPGEAGPPNSPLKRGLPPTTEAIGKQARLAERGAARLTNRVALADRPSGTADRFDMGSGAMLARWYPEGEGDRALAYRTTLSSNLLLTGDSVRGLSRPRRAGCRAHQSPFVITSPSCDPSPRTLSLWIRHLLMRGRAAERPSNFRGITPCSESTGRGKRPFPPKV